MAKWVTLAQVGDIVPGQVRYFEANGYRIALCNVNGEYYAIADECTHDGGPLDRGELEGYEVECPRHGARFDVRTGKPLCLPAVIPVETYPVKVEGGKIKVALD